MSKLNAQSIINYIGNAPKKRQSKFILKESWKISTFQKRFKILSMLKVV